MKEMNDRIPVLIVNYLKDELSKEEKAELAVWLNENALNKVLFEELIDEEKLKERLQKFNRIEEDVVWSTILKKIGSDYDPDSIPVKRLMPWYRIAAVASILIFISIISYLSLTLQPSTPIVENRIQNDAVPGGNKAILTLADGRKISLIDANRGELAEQSGIRITKAADGQLVYEVRHLEGGRTERSLPAVGMTYNTIETPRGGQYQVILPDGTKVWLNAASSLKYPVQFTKNARRVELIGEAYFEVNSLKSAKGDRVPFFVSTSTQTVEVLGTRFNINSYEDEEIVKTTLIEGSVHVFANSEKIAGTIQNTGVLLKPDQQSILKGSYFNVTTVDAEASIAWKNGYFSFTHADLETVMRQLSRWYDVDVVYEGEIPQGTFTGKVYRDMNISKVLEILTYTRVNFRIEGKKMIIFH